MDSERPDSVTEPGIRRLPAAEPAVPRRRVRWRAVIGAALVTAAAGMVLVAHRSAEEPPRTRYLVLTADVDTGSPIEATQLGSVAIDLPSTVDAVAESDADQVIGRVAAHRLDTAGLLRDSDLLEVGRFQDPDEVEIAIAVDSARLPLDAFAVGDTVSVLATDPNGTGTRVVLEDARVAEIYSEDDHGIGSSSGVRIRLVVPDAATAGAVIDAAVREELTLSLPAPRTSGAS